MDIFLISMVVHSLFFLTEDIISFGTEIIYLFIYFSF